MALTILEQSYLFLETVSKNSECKDVHYIVKQTPFNIRFGLTGNTALNFKTCALSCSLIYDLPNRKQVEAIGGKPLDYVCHPSPDGKSCTVEFRIKVLTTQHQNNLFLIQVELESNGGERLAVDTHPIKSVSKPEQIRRRHALAKAEEDVKPVLSSKKRARGEELLTTLEEMKAVQHQQTEMIALLLQQNFQQQQAPSSVPSVEQALALLVRAYEAESMVERPAKIRKTAMSFPLKDQLVLEEISKNISHLRAVPPETRPVVPVPAVQSSFGSFGSPFPMFDLSSVGIDAASLTGDDLRLLDDSLSGWLTDSH